MAEFWSAFIGALSGMWVWKLAELLIDRYAKPKAVIVLQHGERLVLSMRKGLFDWKKEGKKR